MKSIKFQRDKKGIGFKNQTSSLEDNMQFKEAPKVLFPNINAINVSELSFAQGDSLVEKTYTYINHQKILQMKTK